MSGQGTGTGSGSSALSLIPGAVLCRVTADDAPSLVSALATRLHGLGAVTDGFEASVLAREAEYPTGLPTAIPTAIPHTDPEHVVSPGLAVATLREPLAFGEMGSAGRSVPVRLVVMLVLADAHGQVAALQSLIGRLQDEAAVERVLASADEVELARRAQEWLDG